MNAYPFQHESSRLQKYYYNLLSVHNKICNRVTVTAGLSPNHIIEMNHNADAEFEIYW